ncbi:unnamed protein product [Adineta ricciae]|uniref:Uncharacterized protein n=1 Tax=Adineta ricciae TaxID=249248 RepID=A0A814WCB6_ADIRI|nr:unnamed protein product [Adineta ricciae]CAF1627954.1 unnamed protein product [Adineta ricciae]
MYTANSTVISFPDRISTTTQTTSTSTYTTTTNAYCGSTCLNTTVSRLSSVAFYTFDNSTLDSVGNYSMKGNFTPSYVPGWIGSAINFTHSSQYLSTTHIPLDSRSFTIDLWFYATNLTSFRDFGFAGECDSSSTDQCLLLNIRDMKLRLVFFSDDTAGTTNLTENKWYHATFVYDSTVKQQLIYLDGVLNNINTINNHFAATVAPFTIGGGPIGGDAQPFVYYSGYIDHFGIAYRVKTPCEIYLNAILFCYFPFDPTSFLSDSGPNYLSATNSNATQTTGKVKQGVQFLSLSSYITISGVNVLNALNSPFTISMWIKPVNLTGGGTLIHTSTRSDGLDSCFASWGFSSNGSFIVNFFDSLGNAIPMTLSSSFPLNQWTHVVQVFNSSNGNYLYMNGNLMMSASLYARASIGSYIFLGSSPVISSSCKSGSISMGQFFGVIDEFYVFSRALTSTDICRLANP